MFSNIADWCHILSLSHVYNVVINVLIKNENRNICAPVVKGLNSYWE